MNSCDLNQLTAAQSLKLISKTPHGFLFDTEIGAMEITGYSAGIFRIRTGNQRLNDYGLVTGTPNKSQPVFNVSDSSYVIQDHDITLCFQDDPLRFTLSKSDKTLLTSINDGHFVRKQRLPAFARSENGWFVSMALKSGEPVFGLGEKYGPLNRRGQLIYSYNEDALGVNAEISYKNCPFAWSPEGWGLFVNTPAPVAHGVGYPQWSHRSYAIHLEDGYLDLFLMCGDNPGDILRHYTDLTGRAPETPEWSLGVWISRAYYKTAQESLEIAAQIREKKIPCDVFTLDGRAWLDLKTRFAFQWDPSRYPEPKKITAKIKSLGFRICVWEYPLVSIHNPIFRDLAQKGWLLTDKFGETYIYYWDMSPFGKVLTPLPASGIFDFTNPEAYQWWAESHKALFDSGIDIIKSDFGEQVPDEAYAANGDNGRRLHNVYALLYNQCVYEASREYFAENAMVWARSGWTGSQRYPIQWGGDPQADWEGLAGSIRGGLSWGMSGVPYYSHDIGGFYGGPPDPELYIRWAQAGVLGSHCRIHGIGPREPWYFGEEAEEIVRKWLEFRYQLLPYLKQCVISASRTGLPMMRSMVLEFPDDRLSWQFDDQYMLGDTLLVAPVIQPGGKKTVYLPKGRWYDYWSGEALDGGQLISTTSPLEQIPLYGRQGKVLPLGPVVQHTGELESLSKIVKMQIFGYPDLLSPWIEAGQTEKECMLSGEIPETVEVEIFGDAGMQTKGGRIHLITTG
jgi:alpha-D-xyloside xylohydrolase